jgi:hypothetical protein
MGILLLKGRRDEMTTETETAKRFLVISVPTDTDAFWFVYDLQTRRSREYPTVDAAYAACRAANA